MGYKKTDKCIAKAFDDERLFVLMARDEHAPFAIIEWIKLSLYKQPLSQLIEALECAHAMANREGPDLRARLYEAKVLAEREEYLREKAADKNELRPTTYGAKSALEVLEQERRDKNLKLLQAEGRRRHAIGCLDSKILKRHARDEYEKQKAEAERQITGLRQELGMTPMRDDVLRAQTTRLTELPFGTDRVNQTCASCDKTVITLFDGLCSECNPL